jgi:hypothetical protein
MKLFVWDGPNTLCDYSSGIIFAHAETVDEARALALKERGCECSPYSPEWPCSMCESLKPDPKVFQGPTAFVKWGGG